LERLIESGVTLNIPDAAAAKQLRERPVNIIIDIDIYGVG